MSDTTTIKRLRDRLFDVMLELDQADANTFVREVLPGIRSRISDTLQETAPIKTPIGQRMRDHKLQPTGDHSAIARILDILLDDDGEFGELQSCADAISEISEVVDAFRPCNLPKRLKLQPTGEASRDRLLRARLDVRKEPQS
jgi:hypothetical protein